MCGLTSDTINKLKDTFVKEPGIEKAVLYGSRAKGNYNTGSDVDITLVGNNLSLDNLLNIKIALDE